VIDASIKFTGNEQNCLAMLCEVMAAIHHQVNMQRDPPSTASVQDIASVVERFPHTNWGDLYDKFHRQGVNS